MCLRHMLGGALVRVVYVSVQSPVLPLQRLRGMYDVIIRFNLCFVLHLGNVGGEFHSSELTQMLVLLLIIIRVLLLHLLRLVYVGHRSACCGAVAKNTSVVVILLNTRWVLSVIISRLLLSRSCFLVLINHGDAGIETAFDSFEARLTLRACCEAPHQIVLLLRVVVDKTAEVTLVRCILNVFVPTGLVILIQDFATANA